MRKNLIAASLALVFSPTLPIPDPIRLSLEAESRKWFFGLLIAGAVVALGCILEIPETRFSLIQWWRAKRGRPLKEENPTSWRIPAASVGLLLVIVGVVGEVAFEGLASNADTRLRTHESDVLSNAETQAGSANERASEAEKVTAQLRKEAEDEHMARVELEDKVAFRKLSEANKTSLRESMAHFKGMYAAFPCPGEMESCSLASELAKTLRAAGLMCFSPGLEIVSNIPRLDGPIAEAPTGIDISTTEDSEAREAGKVLYSQLQAFGFDVSPPRISPAPNSKPRASQMWVMVLARPEGPQGEAKLRMQKAKTKKIAKIRQ
jgi:hypothetical protein